jgi:hypothetical protein
MQGVTQLPEEGHGEAQLLKEGHGTEEGHGAAQLPQEARAAARKQRPDLMRSGQRTTGGSGGDGGRVGNEDEEAKRAGGGTLEEVRGRWTSSTARLVRRSECCADGVSQGAGGGAHAKAEEEEAPARRKGRRHQRSGRRGSGDFGTEERRRPRSRMEKGEGEPGYIGGLPLVPGGATT